MQIIIPDSGSVIEGFVGDGNFSFFCEVLLPNGDEQATTWSIQQQGDSSPRTLLRDNDLNIIFTGDPIPEAPQFTFNTNLTITALTIELHESTLFCGTQGNLEAANFTILVFRKYSLITQSLPRISVYTHAHVEHGTPCTISYRYRYSTCCI